MSRPLHPLLLVAAALLLPAAAGQYGPEYHVARFDSYPRIPAAGKPWTLIVGVVNLGGNPTRTVRIGLWLNPPADVQPCNATPDLTAPLPPVNSTTAMQAYNATFKLVAPAVTSGANNTTATVLAFADYLCEDAQTPPEYRQTTENFMVTAKPRGWPYIDTTQASLVLAPVFPAEGDKVDLTTQVCNGGSTSHRADRRYLAGVFMSAPSADWVPSCSDVPDATVVVPSMRVFKLPPPGQAIPPAQSDWPCTSIAFRRVAVPRSNRTRRAAVVALLPECERANQGPGMAATVRIGKDYMVTPGVTSQFMFSTKPGEWSVTIPDESDLIPGEPGNSVLTPVKYSPFPVVAGRPVTITATLHNYGSAPGRVGPVAVWLCADTGRYWSRYAEYALNKQINVSSTVDYTRRVLRPGQALTVTFKNVPTPVYSDSLDEGYVYVLMLANVLGTTKEWKQIWGIASYFGFNQ